MHIEYENVIYDCEDGIAVLQLHRPKALNALSGEINRDIMAAVQETMSNQSARVLIVTGSARAFAAGADLKEMMEVNPRSARDICQLAKNINELLENMSIPTIAVVGGFAFGGGFELALSCDFRIGGSRTLVSFPEVGLGIVPGANGMIRACHIVGPSKAKELAMFTDKITGQEAYRLGLLNWYVTGDEALDAAAAEAKKAVKAAKQSGNPEAIEQAKAASKTAEAAASQAEYDAMMAKAKSLAAALIQKPACALAAVKKVVGDAANVNAQQAKLRETTEFSLLFDTHDQREGMTAFSQGRAPVYTNN
ncbi:MAG: enoyl-CoA hydratase/isomerase family protein [Oscillospiraceae bacterium]|nr:enoyl-CoA hydratase/isomerase family protein [Oscillospiraceae bacterium]